MTATATAVDLMAGSAVAELVALLERENIALDGMDVSFVVASLGRKRALVEEIVARSETRIGGRELDPVTGRHLAALVRRNSKLLDAAIHGQRELLKILANAVRGAEERKVYARHGHCAPLTRSTGLTIATSA